MTWLASSRVGHEHECPRVAGFGLADPAEQRQPEGEGLARAGLGLAADVAAGEGVGDGELLDREGFGDALAREGRDEVGGEAERPRRLLIGEVLAFVVGSCIGGARRPLRACTVKGRRGGGSIPRCCTHRVSDDAKDER